MTAEILIVLTRVAIVMTLMSLGAVVTTMFLPQSRVDRHPSGRMGLMRDNLWVTAPLGPILVAVLLSSDLSRTAHITMWAAIGAALMVWALLPVTRRAGRRSAATKPQRGSGFW